MSAEVLEGQRWLNEAYGSKAGYRYVEETGLPGSAMSAALVSALQIELGMSSVTGVFGDQTYSECNLHNLNIGDSGNRVKILQYGLYSKGYNPGTSKGMFNTGTDAAVMDIMADAGLGGRGTEAVAGLQMKAVLGVDEYKLVGDGDSRIRQIQQDLNRLYYKYSGLCACDGHYGRSTNSALIYALQAEEGMPTSMATGTFGPSTKSYCPDINTGETQWGMNGAYSNATMTNFIKIAQCALYCVGRSPYQDWGGSGSNYDPGSISGQWSTPTIAALNSFQRDVGLRVRNWMGLDEWMGLLVSTGNPNRDGTACDCATQLTTPALVASLHNDGYDIVGRYLTGTVGGGASKRDKNLTPAEMQTIFNGGMKLFCIYQDDADWWQDHDDLSGYFSKTRGFRDAQKAVGAAFSLGVPRGEYIYFAVDYDFMEGEVWSKVVPHFQAINNYMQIIGNPYRIGIYSSRNTCGIVSAQELASSSFVSDMSTGYSGNLGYPLPSNWAFDQIQEYTNSAGFAIDKNVVSGKYTGFASTVEPVAPPAPYFQVDLDFKSTLKEDIRTMTNILWSDSWFDASPSYYNNNLAATAMALSAVAYSDSGVVSAGFKKLGFSESDVLTGSVSNDGPIGYNFATKTINAGTSTADLVVVAVRGTANGQEWQSNMDMSGGAASASEHRGFGLAAANVYEALTAWLNAREIGFQSAKILVTGHSRGAAVANLLAKKLMSGGFIANNVFAYTFATPNVAVSVSALPNVHNVVNPEDFVPRAPLEKWGFSKHGITRELPSLSNTESYEYERVYHLMNVYFKSLVGDEHINYVGDATTARFIANVGRYAPSIQDYYETRYGIGSMTTYEYFMKLASVVGGGGSNALADFVTASVNFPDLLDYFVEGDVLTKRIFHAHSPETYISWLKVFSN